MLCCGPVSPMCPPRPRPECLIGASRRRRTLPVVTIRAAGNPSIRLSQDARAAGRSGHSQSRRHRSGGRPPRTCTLDMLSGTADRRSACGSCRADETPPGPEFWSGRIDDAVALRTKILDLERETNAYRVDSRRGGWSLRLDRRPLRRRPFGRGLQPGNLSADRSDPVALCRATGNDALSSWRRRASRAAGRLFGPAAREPAPAASRDGAGTRNPLSHSFRRRPQDGLLLRSAR